jgi:CO dehydrogenase maturation factor
MAADAADGVCIVDTDATVEQFLRIAVIRADAVLVVVEPYFKSLETGRRMARLGRLQGYEHVALVANKVRDEHDAVYRFAEEHELEVAGVIPYDDRLPASEWAQSAPLDFDPQTPAIAAIDALARRLVEDSGRANGRRDGGPPGDQAGPAST